MITDTGVIPPPIVILKYHNSKLEEHDNVIHDIIHQLDYLHSQLDNYSSNGLPVINEEGHHRSSSKDADEQDAEADAEPEQELLMEVVMNDLTNSREFVEGIVDKIVNDTNLSEVIMKIEPLVKENQELRSLIHSQQQMMNEMNTMLLRLLNSNAPSQSQSTEPEESQSHSTEPEESQSHSTEPEESHSHSTEPEESQEEVFQDEGLDIDGLYQPEVADAVEMTEIVLSTGQVELISEEDPDTEPAQIIDLDDTEPEEAAEAAEADKEEPAEEAAEAEEEPETYSEMPHFPIALIVNEIDSPARA
jgi:hypothetical protein